MPTLCSFKTSGFEISGFETSNFKTSNFKTSNFKTSNNYRNPKSYLFSLAVLRI